MKANSQTQTQINTMAKPQIIDSTSPMSVLLDESFTEVHNFKSPLAQVELLSSSFLATVSDDDIDTFDSEIEAYKKDVFNIQRRNLDVITKHVGKLVANIYGSQSKQYKYMMRNFQSNHEVPCFTAMSGLRTAHDIKELVKDAKTAKNSTSSVVLADRDVSQIDNAIQYLTQNDYVYGKDFTATNAVNLAKSIAIQELADNEFKDIIASGSECSEICNETAFDAIVHDSNIKVECACGQENRNMSISIVEDTNNNGHYKYVLEDIANG